MKICQESGLQKTKLNHLKSPLLTCSCGLSRFAMVYTVFWLKVHLSHSVASLSTFVFCFYSVFKRILCTRSKVSGIRISYQYNYLHSSPSWRSLISVNLSIKFIILLLKYASKKKKIYVHLRPLDCDPQLLGLTHLKPLNFISLANFFVFICNYTIPDQNYRSEFSLTHRINNAPIHV